MIDESNAVEILLAVAVIAVAVAAFAWLLLRAGRLRQPGPLIVSLSMLTALALLGALITDSSDAANLAAVGFGALAGSLAAVYQQKQNDDDPPSGDGQTSAPPATGETQDGAEES